MRLFCLTLIFLASNVYAKPSIKNMWVARGLQAESFLKKAKGNFEKYDICKRTLEANLAQVAIDKRVNYFLEEKNKIEFVVNIKEPWGDHLIFSLLYSPGLNIPVGNIAMSLPKEWLYITSVVPKPQITIYSKKCIYEFPLDDSFDATAKKTKGKK